MTHLTDKEIARRFKEGETIGEIAVFIAGNSRSPEWAVAFAKAADKVEAALRRVMLKQEKKK